MSYPVDELLPQLKSTLEQQNNVVLLAPPGAGKTTRIPLALIDSPCLANKKIIMLEPRRVAARAAATFMAQSLGESVGETVGYRVRLENRIGNKTRIEVVTEGILTRLLQNDPALEEYGAVIFDEFHERNLTTDLGLALCIDSQQALREDLKLIVMSATLDGDAVARLLGNASMLVSEGRSFPVETRYHSIDFVFQRERQKFLQEIIKTINKVIAQETGSCLVFLPGAGEIAQVEKSLHEHGLPHDVLIAPLYGQLTSAQQDAAILPAPAGKRKIVLATSIAETSLTIEGVRIVIDSGLMRIPKYDPNTGLTQLITQTVSQANANQRRGRAGRLEQGVCIRLWSESKQLIAYSKPEIQEADLTPLALELALWGVQDVNDLSWLDPPSDAHFNQARDLLQRLGAIDSKGVITSHGKKMSQLGLHPRLSHMIIRGDELGLARLACEVAAVLSERDPLARLTNDTDLLLRIEAIRSPAQNANPKLIRHIVEQAKNWQRQTKQMHTDEHDLDKLGLLLAFAYPDRIAQRRSAKDTRYKLSNGGGAWLKEGDPLIAEEYLVAASLDGKRDARIFLAAAIDKKTLMEFDDDIIEQRERFFWDDRNDSVVAEQWLCIDHLVLEKKNLPQADPQRTKNILIEGIRNKGMACLPWDDSARLLQHRVRLLHTHLGDEWPDFSDQTLSANMEQWLAPYLDNMSRLSHLQKLNLHEILLALIPWERQRQLDELAPTHLRVPSGSNIRIDYSQDPPVLAVRLQEMFGLTETPKILNNRVALLIHLMSPAQRPIQITQDLAGFWQSSYHDVRKEMKGRYPKHHWPENPLQAEATARAKPRKT